MSTPGDRPLRKGATGASDHPSDPPDQAITPAPIGHAGARETGDANAGVGARETEADSSAGLREQTRQQLLDALGGWSGTVVAAIPPVVFVIANSIGGLRQ
ncbi:MAG: hypothetical protein QOE71_3480, partial [Pseudonocardiales bacterium]|nr:hypothetical protein [Pseudonocardiales bacterium]